LDVGAFWDLRNRVKTVSKLLNPGATSESEGVRAPPPLPQSRTVPVFDYIAVHRYMGVDNEHTIPARPIESLAAP